LIQDRLKLIIQFITSLALKSRIVKYSLAAIVLAVLIFHADISQLSKVFLTLSWQAISVLLLLSLALVYTSAIKWRLFLTSFSAHVSTLRLFNLYLLGYFFNLLAPSYIGGDIFRSYYLGKDIGQHRALSSTILERYTGLVAMLSLAFGCMWFSALVTVQIKLLVGFLIVGLAVFTILALRPSTLRLLERFVGLKAVVKHAEKIQIGLSLAKGNYPLLCKAMLLSFVFHILTIANTLACAYAVGWIDTWQQAPVLELFVVVPLILLVGAIPLTPNSLGIQEGAFYYFLQGLGASPAEALAVALILRAKGYLLALYGGLVFLRYKYK
jgi:uncharacterized protein (TIRG00374 family)